jgi:hypothetical protein
MKTSWIKYLGFLGFLGLLGLFTSNLGFMGFFGFFSFFAFGKVLNDERLERNVNKSGRNAFIVSMPVFVISTIIVAILKDISVYVYAFIVTVVLQISTFSISLNLYERGEKD